ncbi:MAG TPA: M48 family metallopeptidase [Methylophilaceae bacterium]|nr:M48 family metallopeptidase [Methylophilaceae bacterium]
MNLRLPSRTSTIAALLVALAGCATPQTRMPTVDSTAMQEETRKQREMVVEDYMNSYRRLQAVASKIVVSGTELCADKVGPYYGLTAWSREDFDKEWHDVVQSRFGVGDVASISSVVPGSAAEYAGVKAGDVVISVNGWTPPAGKGAVDKLMEKLMEKLAAEGKFGMPLELVVRRGAEEVKLSMMPGQACDFHVRLSPDDVKNAYADGKNIVIYKGMMDFFRTDEEVALVVSHELAHNAMKHIDAKKTNAMVGGLVGLLLDVAAAAGGVNTNGDFTRLGSNIGAGVYSVSFEQEADYVGLYFMANAGYKIDDAAGFWRRMATTNSKAITMKSSHPTTPERFIAIESAVDEIKQKLHDGQPLKPELKDPPQEIAKEEVRAIPH